MSEYSIPMESVEKFLSGHGEEKYIVNIEYESDTNTIYKIKDIPEQGIVIEKEFLKSFMWIKNLNEVKKICNFYHNNDLTIKIKMKEYGIQIKKLRHDDHPRLVNGYTYLVTCEQGHKRMLSFFADGGINFYNKFEKRINLKEYFTILSPIEQYFISTGNRLYKGIEDYNELTKLIFDLETTGLDPNTEKIFLIGCKTNKGYEKLIEIEINDPESEKNGIIQFFNEIDAIKPTIIGGYNSANFDWYFIFKRCQILGIDIENIAKTLKKDKQIYVTEQILKLGNEVERYIQTNMFGYSIIDINHSTRRAQAIDSDMKFTRLKYVCKYNDVAKSNRVYIVGENIGKYWKSDKKYYFDDKSGSYSEIKPKVEYMDFITRQIVKDNPDKIFIFGDNDLREGFGGQAKEMRNEKNAIGIVTKKAPSTTDDCYYNDDEFELNKKKINLDLKIIINEIKKGKCIVIPSSGIGTGLAKLQEKAPKTFKFLQNSLNLLKLYCDSFVECDGKYIVNRYLMDDLWETLEVDNIYNQSSFMLAKLIPTSYQRVSTMGTAGLWKMLMLTWSYENDLAIPINDEKRDFVGGLSRLFKVGFSKKLRKMDYSSLYPSIQLAHEVFPSCDITHVMKSLLKYFHSERFKAKNLAKKYGKAGDKQMKSFYDRKQLPLKIFINSMFGALGAPTAFNWAEMDVAEGITARARQYLRIMVKFFMAKGYEPLVLDTDGVNFMAPESGEENFRYIGLGNNEAVTKDKEYTGVDAVIAEFNDLFMKGEMALSLDGTWPSTINLARKNYALLEDSGKVKLTGNSIKSKKMPAYIEEFLDKALVLLLNEKGSEFVNYYNTYVQKIYNKEIPLSKIATKARVKKTLEDYKNRELNKNGKPLPKQAHMELAIINKLNINLGDTLYYVNNGTKLTQGDIQTVKVTKKGWSEKDIEDHITHYGKSPVGLTSINKLNCYMLDSKELEDKPDMLGEYNVAKYLDAFNKRIKPLLVVFSEDIRAGLLLKNPSDKKDYLKNELKLINGIPYKEADQDTIQDLFTPSDLENDYWKKMNYDPNFWFNDKINFTVPGLDRVVEIENI
jgi:DNA polymerase elongation subunit (family B)